MPIDPFLKWPGGKRWLPHKYHFLFPNEYNTYYEPFLGGAAIFFYLEPPNAILSDSNEELINTYKCIKNNYNTIDCSLNQLQSIHCKDKYYKIRAISPNNSIQRAIRFLYLNRTCFNGLYRVNLNGKFNVPMGTKNTVSFPENYLKDVSQRLNSAKLIVSDFESIIDSSSKGDFLYVDPPYTVMHNNNNFLKYNAKLFSWEDQIRLAAALRRADKRGVLILISNADHYLLHDLYRGFGYPHIVNRSSILAASPNNRVKTTELLITSYKTK